MDRIGYFAIACFTSLILNLGICTLSDHPNLHHHVRRALESELLSLDIGNSSDTMQRCFDQLLCDSVPGICEHNDTELVSMLCPIKCGHCICEDSPATGGNCSDLVPGICYEVLGHALCAASCNTCGDTAASCVDLLDEGLSCASLPDPCNDTAGQIVCQNFCNLCDDVPATVSPCPAPLATTARLGCQPVEVIFMLEYSIFETPYDVYWEGSFVTEVLSKWRISKDFVRVGLVVYHDNVTETIHLDEYEDDAEGLKQRIYNVTSKLRPSGEANIGAAFDYVRQNSFVDARPDVEKVVVFMIREIGPTYKSEILPATALLKKDCVSIIGLTIYSPSIDYTLIASIVSKPANHFFFNYGSFYELEFGARQFGCTSV